MLDVLFVLSGLTFLFVFFLALIFLAIFPLWMTCHAIIRTIKLWPNDSVLNLLFLVLICTTNFVGAFVYYFVCYRVPTVPLQHAVN
ncbi:MAG: hypothetical protein UW30_C0013G0009 [Candidatus Giovannonibacteria bacterium GW2011_GWA2_44_13b]|uniref:Uncharacterized protein n=2 Tax=Candidatus Giovannoniibacteriota TaxID=1752738 RepID=A0A0G1H2I4_9BACT|nr:MAG: hypothetical protein UW30_C0013G0009 [Candidatus Giovannonibacteria bacterium GW2011_GWA2_44_13b]OGF81977.1 MAG: hypothetical protein A2924_04645 [Candidatus Giovannonibacteria bacterium RIFCSPLOWO2_01_FULL_44_16]